MLHIPTTSTTLGCPKRGARHRFLPALVGLAVILLGLVSMTFAAKHTPNPASIPLPISGTMDEKGIPVGWDLETFQNHHQIKLDPLKDGQFGIRLVSEESSFGLHKSVEVDLKEFPILTWRWKVDRLPLAGDVREKSKNDQAAQIYVIFPNSLIRLRSPMLGYLWDSNAPAGTTADGYSPVTPIKVMVLRSGKQQLGKWVQERRNVAEDYVRLFGQNSLPKVGRVAIWINSQHTKSTAQASFADLQFQRAN
ncbi:DUF3047 domain-containing protein [Candidatus Methylomirabilis sp.]|uniref:DUF3047 domain-containing protein n=1 Tax=Candidatus Methylomirabilis sp. TaxID=2032687 RepID=UPI002A697BB3|nr:DUF3047 domain-containing protein [Candidatus Methylomirabilis sp.]